MQNQIIPKIEDYPDVLTPRQVAEILQFSEQKIYQMLRHDKKLPARKMGRSWRILKADLIDWLGQQ